MQVRFAIKILLLSLLAWSTSPVRGAGAAKADSVEDLIKRGVKLREQNKPAEALEVFERAHAVAPSPRTLGHIGLAEAALDRWVEASDHLAGALAVPEDYWARGYRIGMEQTLERCKRHVGEISVTGPAGVEVFTDGKRVGALPLTRPIRVVAGNVVVRAVSPDYEPFATTVVVIGGGRTVLTLALTSAQAAAPPPAPVMAPRPPPRPAAAAPALPPPSAPPAPDAGRTWKTPAGAAVGVAGAGLLAWGAIWIAIDGNTFGGMVCATCAPRVRTTKTAGWILAGTGAAAMLGGGLLLYSDGGGTKVALGATTSGLLLAGAF